MHPSMHRNERGSFVYYTCDRLPVRHAFTTKFGGVSRGDCESLNLGFNRATSGRTCWKTTAFWRSSSAWTRAASP